MTLWCQGAVGDPPPLDPNPLPTGQELFSAMSVVEQEKAIGAEPARLVREGEADLKDFVSHSDQVEQQNFLTQRPISELLPQ